MVSSAATFGCHYATRHKAAAVQLFDGGDRSAVLCTLPVWEGQTSVCRKRVSGSVQHAVEQQGGGGVRYDAPGHEESESGNCAVVNRLVNRAGVGRLRLQFPFQLAHTVDTQSSTIVYIAYRF